MTELTFPQPGDLPDAAYFAFATGRGRSGIISGLTLAAEFSIPEVTVDPGKAVIDRGDMTTVHPNINPPDTVSDAVAVVEIESQTVGLNPDALNHIFLDANTDQDDSGVVVSNTTGSKPTPESVKIGEVDTATDTVSEQWNLITDDGTLSYPNADAANTSLQSLSTGVTVIDRSNGVRITDSISVGTIESGSTDIIDELGIPIYSDSINAPQREGNLIRVDGSNNQAAGLYLHDGSSYVKAGKTEDKVRELAYSVHRRQSL